MKQVAYRPIVRGWAPSRLKSGRPCAGTGPAVTHKEPLALNAELCLPINLEETC